MNHSKIFLFFASFVFSSIFFLFFARGIYAQEVVINELGVIGENDWFELFAYKDVDISGWYLDDLGTATTVYDFPQNSSIGPSTKSIFLVRLSGNRKGRFNDSGDVISLFKPGDPNPVEVDTVSYGDKGGVCLPEDELGSIGRTVDTITGLPTSLWQRFSNSSPGESNDKGVLYNCPTPTPSPTPSPTPTPTQSSEKPKATLKINDARDQNDNVVSGATQIYIDGNYTGNYAPETYTFCDDCKCGSNKVSCGFGSHTIKVEKTGYKSWTKTIDISAGNNYEETPLLTISTPTPSPTPKPSATPKASPTPSLRVENTIQASESALTLNSSPEPRVLGLESAKREEDKEATSSDSYFNLAAVFFIIAGLSFLSAASYAYFKSKKKKEEKQNENKDSEDQEDF